MAPSQNLLTHKRAESIEHGETTIRYGKNVSERVPSLSSVWKPWADAEIEVITHLLAPSKRWPDWYVRMHEIYNKGTQDISMQAVQGGFAIQGRGHKLGETLPVFTEIPTLARNKFATNHSFQEGTLQIEDGALVCSNAGSSGIRAITTNGKVIAEMAPEVLKPDANTNLIWQRTLIPTLKLKTIIASNTDENFCEWKRWTARDRRLYQSPTKWL